VTRKTFIVTGTDTDIGKTVFAAGLTAALGAYYYKPVQAGLDGGSDAARVRDLGVPEPRILRESYRLRTPCSPHRAAELDGIEIDTNALTLPQVDGPLVVEGAGGALVPVTRTVLYADLFARWACPTIIVARTRLGTINHSLMTIEALRLRSVPVQGIAFVGEAEEDSERTICEMGEVAHLGRLPLLDPLDPQTLAASFANSFDLAQFR
jgi:dethiobiotin synthetase